MDEILHHLRGPELRYFLGFFGLNVVQDFIHPQKPRLLYHSTGTDGQLAWSLAEGIGAKEG